MVLSQSSNIGAVLDSLRVSGAVLSLALLEAPFAVTSGRVPTGVFHAVLDGQAWARVGHGDPVHLAPGQAAFFPAGDPHVISDEQTITSTPVPVTSGGDGPVPTMEVRNGGPETRILCGTISFGESPVLAPAAGLPAMVVGGDAEAGRWVAATVDMVAEELGSGAPGAEVVTTRLVDVLVIRALRETLASSRLEAGWAAGLQDRHIAAALGALHADPSRTWTAALLANEAHMSRSAFYVRFTELVGIPPATYLARWRIHVACELLRSWRLTIADVGRRVGFQTPAAFSTAFKRMVGQNPGAYRRASTTAA